jgi:hypothetical protein
MVSLYIYINKIIDLLMRPMEGLHPLVPLALWSVIVGVVAMIIYKYTSNQDGIHDAKEKIKGHFYEVWLYIDDAAVIARAQLLIMLNALRYLGYALPPLVIMIVIFFPLFANFETRYAMRPVAPGDDVLVKLRLTGHFDGWQDVKLDLQEGVAITGHPIRFIRKILKDSKGIRQEKSRDYEINYKLRPERAGSHQLRFKAKGESFTVPLVVGGDYGARVPPYSTTSLGTALLFPPVAGIPAKSGVRHVEITYPEAEFPFLGWNTWWIWPFLIISIIAALAVKGVFKVEI